MRKLAILMYVIPISVALMGCGGDATITIINNTSVYVDGDFDGKAHFGFPPGGQTTRTIEVGSFWHSSSDVNINCRFYETEDYSSGIASYRTFVEEFKADEIYYYDIFFGVSGRYIFRQVGADGQSGILQP